MNNTEEDWIKILSGKRVPDANPEIIRETQALRMELKFRKAQTLSTESISSNPQILQNVFKATGLKPNKQVSLLRSLLTWKITLPFPILAMVILTVIIIPQAIIKPVEPIIIGKPKSLPQYLPAPNPQTTAGELIFGLAKLGLMVNVVENKGIWIINVEDSSIADSTALKTFLKKYGLFLMSKRLEIHIHTK